MLLSLTTNTLKEKHNENQKKKVILLASTLLLIGCGETPEQIAAQKKVERDTKIRAVTCSIIAQYAAELPEPTVNDYQLAASFHIKAITTFMELNNINYTDASLKVDMLESKASSKIRSFIYKRYTRNHNSLYNTTKGLLFKECN